MVLRKKGMPNSMYDELSCCSLFLFDVKEFIPWPAHCHLAGDVLVLVWLLATGDHKISEGLWP